MDRLAEKIRRWTLYNYAYNNQLYFIAPDIMQTDDCVKLKTGELLGS